MQFAGGVAYVDAGYTGEEPRQAAAAEGIALEVVKLPALKRDFAGPSRFRRLARDRERLAEVVKGFHLIACIMVMWTHALAVLGLRCRP